MDKIVRPNRKPDISEYNDTKSEMLEIWLDEMIDCWHEIFDDVENTSSYGRIRLTETGDVQWFDETAKHEQWNSYDSLDGFRHIKGIVHQWIADKIILGGYMTETQKAFVELDKKKAEYKEFMKLYRDTVDQLKEEMGLGGHFQDYEGTVYQVEECEGKFVYTDKYEVKRTRRDGERAGSLSIKKAKELGYDVE